MDSKHEIAVGLAEIGRNRRWLGEQTGYSYNSVRDCLAPAGKKLSRRMARAFAAAIEHERQVRRGSGRQSGSISFTIAPELLAGFQRHAGRQSLSAWILSQALPDKRKNWLWPNPNEIPPYETIRSVSDRHASNSLQSELR